MRISKKSIIELILVLALKITIEIIYVQYVSIDFEYMGLYLHLSTIKLIESYILTILLFLFLNRNERRISSVVSSILYLVMIIPTLSLYALKDESRLFLYIFVLSFFVILLIVKLPYLSVWNIKSSYKAVFPIMLILSLVTFAILIIHNGFPTLKGLNLLNVYEIRETVIYRPFFMNYLVMWQAKVINLFFLGVSIYRKSFLLFVLSLGMQLVLFLITGHKSFLFAPFMVIGIIYAVKKGRFFIYSVIGIILLSVNSYITYLVSGNNLFVSLFVRRMLFVPAQNYFYYHDFFSNNNFIYLSHSIFKKLLDYPYDMPVPNIVGETYYNSSSTWVNTGFLADAFMNFGYIGMLIFAVFLGMILLVLDSFTKNINYTIIISTTIFPFFSLVDGALLTTMLTSGLLFGLFTLYLYSNAHKSTNSINT